MGRYTLSMRIFHWLMAAMLLCMVPFGMWMADLPQDNPDKFYYYGLHKSFGVIVLILVSLRIINRWKSQIPELPKEIKKFDQMLSAATVVALYLCMFVMPISGYLMSTFGGHPVAVFSLTLPALVAKNPDMGKLFLGVHEVTAYCLVAAFVLHIAGTLKHFWVEKVNLLKRMW